MLKDCMAGKSALVTGTASPVGFGAAIAKILAEDGASRIFLADLAADQSATAEIVRRAGAEPICFSCDLTNEAAVNDMFARISADYKDSPLSALVNNAGIADVRKRAPDDPPRTDFTDSTAEEFMRLIEINLLTEHLCGKAAKPLILENGGGAIVNIASIGGRFGSRGCPEGYSSAKAGVPGLSRVWAQQWAPRIRSNTICPGPGNTAMWQTLPAEKRELLLASTPLKRVCEPEDISEAVLYFATDRSKHATGAILDINGGLWYPS